NCPPLLWQSAPVRKSDPSRCVKSAAARRAPPLQSTCRSFQTASRAQNKAGRLRVSVLGDASQSAVSSRAKSNTSTIRTRSRTETLSPRKVHWQTLTPLPTTIPEAPRAQAESLFPQTTNYRLQDILVPYH